jgi:Arc/MetJ-type ribon-helix-helix transcriptional regulator
MNVSLTPELVRAVQDRVQSGLYGTASEVVREALRLLVERDRVASQPPGIVSDRGTPKLELSDWRELREALLAGEAALMTERARETSELFSAGIELARSRIARELPGASEKVLQKHLAQWLRERAGADFGGGPGVPVSEERLRKILGD